MTLSASVGAAGRNRRPDVLEVQRLLRRQGMEPGPIDGQCGTQTTLAIVRFQGGFMTRPDGRVDPGGLTWRHLIRGGEGGGSASAGAAGSAGSSVAASDGPALEAPASVADAPPTDLLERLPRPERGTLNPGLVAVNTAFMREQLGNPRESYTADCQPMTLAALRRHLVTQSVGPFNVTGLRPAVDSLRAAFAQVRSEQPGVYAALGTAGMLCCRYVRGSTTAISNHSWGTAIDLTLDGVLDRRGDDRVQLGLMLIASIMNEHGWYWGAAFRTEDAMHFEASRSLITQWAPNMRPAAGATAAAAAP